MENEEQSINHELSLTDKAVSQIKYSKGYMIFLVIILGLAHVLDEYATLAPASFSSAIIQEFFLDTNWFTEYNDAMGFINTLQMSAIIFMIFGFFYKALMDRIGRKPIFIISATGMTIGVIIMIVSGNYWVYFIGTSFLTFFTGTDMQYQFINEETPTKWRAQAFSYAKILGLVGLLAAPVIYDANVVGDTVNWRPIMYVPAIIGVIVVVFSIFFLKETRAYRIMQEERKIDPDAFAEEKINLKIAFQRMKKMPTWDQVKWLIILGALFVPFALLNQNYTDHFMEQAGIPEANRALVQTLSIISVGIAYITHGIFTDKVGRKPAYAINAAIVVILLPVEYVAVMNNNLWIAGISQGLRIGAFWNITDVNRFMLIENVPTGIRGSAQAIQGLFMFLAIIPTMGITIGLMPNMTYAQVGLMIVGIPLNLLMFIIVLWKLKETKNVDITKIEG